MKRACTVYIFTAVIIILSSSLCCRADEIKLKNGDRITGRILRQLDSMITIETDAMGPVDIKREFIADILTDKDIKAVESKRETKLKKEEPCEWKREVSAGYNITSGNTSGKRVSGKFLANKKTKKYEFTLKGSACYSSSDRKMDSQKYAGMTRSAFSFGPSLKWYNFYSIDADHDRFADIDYRLVPASGIGYWFFDHPDFKAMLELGAGVEHTDFRSNIEDKTEMVLIPRGYLEKRLWGESHISEDIKIYPALTDSGEFRIYSETAFTNPITDIMSLRVSVIDEYNSDPPKDTKNNDIRLVSSIVYTF